MIDINEKYAIDADGENIVLAQKHTTGKGTSRLEYVGFYSSLRELYTGLVNRELKIAGLDTWQTVLDRIDQIHALIKSLPNITAKELNDLRKRERGISDTPEIKE